MIKEFLLLCALALHAAAQNAFDDNTKLNAPALPSPLPPLAFDVTLATTPTGLGVVQDSLLGFSLEMSVSNSLFGKSKSRLNVILTQLLRNVAQRAGHVKVRVGGNSQEGAVMVDQASLGGNVLLQKEDAATDTPTDTPNIRVSTDIIAMMSSISTQTNVGWYVGIPFNDTNFRLQIAELAQSALGDNLLGMQLGNEPDLYGRHHRRDENTWSPKQYFDEFGLGVKAIQNDDKISAKNKIVGPSVALSNWTPEQVWDTGYINAYKDSLSAISVERYPASNCGAIKDLGKDVDPQDELIALMTHKAAQDYVAPYLNSAKLAQEAGKPFVVMEFNTGTCSGFPGLSNAFGAAMWIVDASMQMAHSNYSGAMLHVGGQDAYYNPFTPPPGADAMSKGWTVGPSYYATLVVAEALGSSNKSRVIDLNANGGNQFTPAYGVYEDGAAAAQRAVLLNFMTDASGKADYTATLAVPSSVSSVKVKYMKADSTAAKTGVTWAGQTFGGVFESRDGLPKGDVHVETVQCSAGKCPVKVPAPAAAVVFLNDKAFEASNQGSTTTTAGSGKPSGTSTGKAGSATTGSPDSDSKAGDNSGAMGVRAAVGLIGASVFASILSLV